MQIPEHADVKREDNELLKFLKREDMPIGIEEFISNKESPSTRNVFKMHTPIRFANEKDIPQLIDVNNQVYDGHYPYRDMLDVEYVSEFTTEDRDQGFIGVYETEDKKTIGGFLLLAVDHNQRKGYFRGLMVSPEHRKRLYLKNRVLETIYQGYKQYSQDVEMWYGETRTAHPKGQKWMEESGSRPCAFLPNKDIFTSAKVRESDILEIAYGQKALYQYRNTKPHLLTQFKPLYSYILRYFDFPEIEYTLPSSSTPISSSILSKARDLAEQCSIQKNPEPYNTYTYRIQTINGSYMQFLVNTSIASAEKTEFHITSTLELTALLLRLKTVVENEKLEYFEVYVPATNTEYQQVFLDLGFSCFGYVPSWKWNETQLDDCLLFGLYRTPIDWNRTALTKNSKSLIEILQPFLKEL